MLRKSKVLFFSLVACISLSHAEDDGGFFTVGYELGQVMQDVKNPGKSQANALARELNSNMTNNVYINQGNSQGGNIVGALSNTFTKYLYSLLGAYQESQLGIKSTPNPQIGSKVSVISLAVGAPNVSDSQVTDGGSPLVNPNSLNQMAKLLLDSVSGGGYCGDLTSPTIAQCKQAGYSWTPSLKLDIANNLQSGYQSTTFPGLASQLSYLSSANVFFNAIQSYLNGLSSGSAETQTERNLASFITDQQKVLEEVAPMIQKDARLLAEFNAANNGDSLTSAQFSNLVQGIVNESQSILNKLKSGEILSKAGSSSLQENTIVQITKNATGLSNYFANAQNTLQKIESLNAQVESTPYLPQFRAGNSRQTNIMNGFYTKWGYKQFFGKKRNIGLRYYGFFSYNGASVGFRDTYN
ncbi:outer membrane beta-barrel protein, partial [Helicobacter cetorum]|uniref:outer membrane beta-barrel protein n=1 Tax=Helicobacter cetorum TaxID=138563 RepID=UPI000CF11DA8